MPDDGQTHEYSFDLSNLSDDYQLADTTCDVPTSHAGGGDAVFEIQADADDVIEVDWNDGADVAAGFIDRCGSPSGRLDCLDDGRLGRESSRLAYVAENTGTYRLLVDRAGSTGTGAPVDLSIEVSPRACDPATRPVQCRNGQTLEYCRFPGFVRTHTCDGGCQSGECGEPSGAICEDAVEVPRDGKAHTYTFDLSKETDDYEVTPEACPTTPYQRGNGREVVARVDAAAGEVIDVDWEAANTDETLAVVTDCNDLDGSFAPATEVGASSDLRYVAEYSGTFYIIADTLAPNSPPLYGTGELTVQVRQPTCQPHTALGCTGSDELEFCNYAGLREPLTCSGTCTATGCQPPTGEVCGDAVELADGDVVSQDFSGELAIPITFGRHGNCQFDSQNRPVVDDVYRVELQAGERLSVTYDTGVHRLATSRGVLYLTGSPCGKISACEVNTDQLQATNTPIPGALTYTASSDETVYLVVGLATKNPSSRHDYQVEVDID